MDKTEVLEYLHYIPITIFVAFPTTVILTYAIAVVLGHVDGAFPYISDTTTYPPESCIFAQAMNMIAVLMPERETNLECSDRSRTDVKINTLHQVLDKVSDMKNLQYVGCQAHNEELTKRVINYYLVMRGHFLARSVNKNNYARKILTKDNRKKLKL